MSPCFSFPPRAPLAPAAPLLGDLGDGGIKLPPQDPLGASGPPRSPRSVPAGWSETPCPRDPPMVAPSLFRGAPPMGKGRSEQGLLALRGLWEGSCPTPGVRMALRVTQGDIPGVPPSLRAPALPQTIPSSVSLQDLREPRFPTRRLRGAQGPLPQAGALQNHRDPPGPRSQTPEPPEPTARPPRPHLLLDHRRHPPDPARSLNSPQLPPPKPLQTPPKPPPDPLQEPPDPPPDSPRPTPDPP